MDFAAVFALLTSPAFLTGVGSVVTVLGPILAHANGWNLGPLSSLLSLLGIAPAPAPSPSAPPPTPSLEAILNELLSLIDTPVTPPAPTPGVTPTPTPAAPIGLLRGMLGRILAKRHNLPAGSPTLAQLTDTKAQQIAALVSPKN